MFARHRWQTRQNGGASFGLGRYVLAVIYAGALLCAAPVLAQGTGQNVTMPVADCAPQRIGVTTPAARHLFSIEVADTEASRAQGLMNRAKMSASAGMLFIYPQPQRAQFWMANTLIPLDMIFAGPDGVILHVHENAVPLDQTLIDGGEGVQFVLEINGGLARRMGIAKGGALHHPAIAGSDCAPN